VLGPDNVWASADSGTVADDIFHWNGSKWQYYLPDNVNFIPQDIAGRLLVRRGGHLERNQVDSRGGVHQRRLRRCGPDPGHHVVPAERRGGCQRLVDPEANDLPVRPLDFDRPRPCAILAVWLTTLHGTGPSTTR
jgi:hypothetical protein